MDDAKLASALAKGDRNAFDEIYRKYHIPLYQTAYLITGNASDAEDVLQETFVTAYTKIRELRKPEALRSWLFQILSRCALGMIRRRTREVPDEQIVEKSEEKADLTVGLGVREYSDAEDRLIIGEWLQQLDPAHREVVVLFYYNEMSTGEIAKVLGIFEGTVRSRLYYARKELKRISKSDIGKGGSRRYDERETDSECDPVFSRRKGPLRSVQG